MVIKENAKILCLDDAPIILSALKRELELEGYAHVTVCTDGTTALNLAAQEKFDLYVVDQTMPNMLGTEFVERLSEFQENALVFILTGQDQEGKALQLCRRSIKDTRTVVHYFTKPWDTGLFIEMQRALELRQRQSEMEKQVTMNQLLANMGLSARKLAHEIRNPLGIISGAAQLMENHIYRFESSTNNQTCTEIIISEVNRLSNLLDDLSVYNKANQLKLEKGNINRLLSGMVDLLRIDGSNKHIQFDLQLDPMVPDSLFDTRKLHQTFLNIGKNAIEAMGAEGQLTIATQWNSTDQTIMARITDTGAGIPTEDLQNIFELFFTSKGEKGNGIGLAIAKQFIETHSGEIWATSEIGKGSTFHIRLKNTLAA
ncbi:MAG: response regulator [Acidobacteria bacterium]|nr:response regulator [Acidobacteriota bacterium]